MDLWDRHSRQKERGSSSGPEVGVCLVIPGAALRQTEDESRQEARGRQAAHRVPGLGLQRGALTSVTHTLGDRS